MWFDIIVIAVGVCCLWSGWRSGILVQLSGIIGVVLGTWVAYYFCEKIASWAGIQIDNMPYWLLFAVVLIGVMVIVIVLSHLITGLLKAGGIALPLRVLGMAFALIKGALLLSLLLFLLESFGSSLGSGDLLKSAHRAQSYPTIRSVSDFTFPYLHSAKGIMEQVIDQVSNS